MIILIFTEKRQPTLKSHAPSTYGSDSPRVNVVVGGGGPPVVVDGAREVLGLVLDVDRHGAGEQCRHLLQGTRKCDRLPHVLWQMCHQLPCIATCLNTCRMLPMNDRHLPTCRPPPSERPPPPPPPKRRRSKSRCCSRRTRPPRSPRAEAVNREFDWRIRIC